MLLPAATWLPPGRQRPCAGCLTCSAGRILSSWWTRPWPDHGRLYKPFAPDFPRYMKKVCTRADVLLPNLTEACLLTDTPYREDPDEAFVQALLQKLSHLAPRVVLTGVSFDDDRLGAMSYDRTTGRYFAYYNEKVHAGFHGTGDIFTATVLGAMMQGRTLEQAVTLAVDFTLECIRCTWRRPGRQLVRRGI